MRKHAERTPAIVLLVLCACASPIPRGGGPVGGASAGGGSAGQAAPAQRSATAEASYDWHGLVIAPFGTLFKESPLALHEVLVFQEDAHGPADGDFQDCYAPNQAPPQFVGRQPDDYVLCFDHDRLSKIEARVRLAADEAAQIFAKVCAQSLKGAAQMAGTGNACDGRDGGIAWSARLGQSPGEATAPLDITLSAAAEPR